jgi:hypothetical protein
MHLFNLEFKASVSSLLRRGGGAGRGRSVRKRHQAMSSSSSWTVVSGNQAPLMRGVAVNKKQRQKSNQMLLCPLCEVVFFVMIFSEVRLLDFQSPI